MNTTDYFIAATVAIVVLIFSSSVIESCLAFTACSDAIDTKDIRIIEYVCGKNKKRLAEEGVRFKQ